MKTVRMIEGKAETQMKLVTTRERELKKMKTVGTKTLRAIQLVIVGTALLGFVGKQDASAAVLFDSGGFSAPTYTNGNLASAYSSGTTGQDGWWSFVPALTVANSGVTGQGQAVHNTDGTAKHAWHPVTTTGDMIVETSMRFLTLSSDSSSYGIDVVGREGVDGQFPNSWDFLVYHDSTGLWSVRNFQNLSGFENITGNFTPVDNKIDVQLRANLANRTFNIFVQSGSSSWTNTLPAYWTTGADGTPMTGMILSIGASTPGSVWVDDVLIQSVVPEPSTMMLLGVGGLLLCRKHRQTARRCL